MKRIVVILLILITSFSCTTRPSDPKEFGKLLVRSLSENNFKLINPLLLKPSDSVLIKNDSARHKFSMQLGNKQDYNAYLKRKTDDFNNIRQRGSEIGINWDKVQFISLDLVKEIQNNQDFPSYSGDVILKFNNSEYLIKIDNVLSNNREFFNFSLNSIVNKKEDDIERHQQLVSMLPYTGLDLSSGTFELNPETLKIKDLRVNAENRTSHDFSYLKIKITFYFKNKGIDQPILSKTIEREMKLFKGDKFPIYVKEFENIKLPIKANEVSNIDVLSEIIDANIIEK
jgi:hypothetical protein